MVAVPFVAVVLTLELVVRSAWVVAELTAVLEDTDPAALPVLEAVLPPVLLVALALVPPLLPLLLLMLLAPPAELELAVAVAGNDGEPAGAL